MYTGAAAGVQSHAQGQGQTPMGSEACADAGGASLQRPVVRRNPV
jgi:hypothetical protein